MPIPPAGYKAPARRTLEAESEEQREITFVTTHFKVGTVFDVSYLIEADQQRVPQFFPSIYGDHEALHQRIVKQCRQKASTIASQLIPTAQEVSLSSD